MIYSNVMLDLETMGNGSNAAIVAIGACAFDLESGKIGRIERLGTAHNALDDAVSQARHLITLLHPAKREEAILLQQAVNASF